MLSDEWGLLKQHRKSYRILQNHQIPSLKKHKFEQLLKSSISLDAFEKIKIIVSAHRLTKKQINELIKIFTNELTRFNSIFLQERVKIENKVKTKEREWEKIEMYIEDYTSDELIIDNKGHITPSSIKLIMEKYVKGQPEAIKSIAILLYYQNKLNVAYQNNKELPFKALEPILICGQTGTGKSFMLEVGSDIIGLPYLHVDCSSLVSAGIVGNNLDSVLKNLLRKVNYDVKSAETSIILFDEIDKLLSRGHFGDSILFQLLRFVEGTVVPIDNYRVEEQLKKIPSISTHRMLFIFSGSFQKAIDEKLKFKTNNSDLNQLEIADLEKAGIPTELLGRINKIIVLNNLNRETYREILLDSKNSPLNHIKSLLALNKQDFIIEDNTIESILDTCDKSQYGARSLKQAVWQNYEPLLFEAPEALISSNELSKDQIWIDVISSAILKGHTDQKGIITYCRKMGRSSERMTRKMLVKYSSDYCKGSNSPHIWCKQRNKNKDFKYKLIEK